MEHPDPEYRKACERRYARERKAAEVKREVERQLNYKPNSEEQNNAISEHLNDLRRQYKRIHELEKLRDTNIREYWECGGSDELSRLKGITT